MLKLDEFIEFLSIPSISSEPDYKEDVRRAANWVRNRLEKLGFKVEFWEKADRHPIVFATTAIDPKKPTLLIYNHYDVQPVDPLDLWESPPFEPKIKDGQVYARGAQDNKGQCFYVLEGLRLLKERDGSFPINIKLCIEGEEEFGSTHLQEVVKEKKRALQADYVAIVDLGIPSIDTPAVTLGTRGIITFNMTAEGSKVDLHSGCHGGLVYNPIHALVKLLASARDSKGKITIPGFYDDVETMTPQEREHFSFDFNHKQYEEDFAAQATGGETTYQPLERLWLRPTFEINGIWGGYTGDGFKTVIPAKAQAKFSCRLVPHQKPEKIGQLVKEYFEKNAPSGIRIHVDYHGGGEAARANPNSKAVKAFAKAYSEVFGKPCQFILEGATIPIIPELVQASGAEPVLIGLGLTTDLIHAPNEHFGIDRLEKGAKIIMRAIELLA
jgi:acetylornithine deacetylase/succinyl-diaminopimelate desuccinylase-like protein